MTDLIDSVAKLTDLRDVEVIEIALASLMFDQLKATELTLWRVVRRDGEVSLRQRIKLPARQYASNAARKLDMREIRLSDTSADMRSCIENRVPLSRARDSNGTFAQMYPVIDGREIVCLLEILLPTPPSPQLEHTVFGLLRIYCNLVGILNFSDHDELTGLLNRRTFGEAFKRIVALEKAPPDSTAEERRRFENATSGAHLAVVDIDFFKRINDQFGHPYGDEVLVLLARLMGRCFREGDRTFRFGGEEFLVILPDTNFYEAEQALERFRIEVEAFSFSQVGRVTVSVGFTAILPGDSGPDAFGRADQALYVAKHSGRNQVQCYELLIAKGSLVSTSSAEQDVEMF